VEISRIAQVQEQRRAVERAGLGQCPLERARRIVRHTERDEDDGEILALLGDVGLAGNLPGQLAVGEPASEENGQLPAAHQRVHAAYR
jgi:hypothetical protein